MSSDSDVFKKRKKRADEMKMATVAAFWRGDVDSTHKALADEGYEVSKAAVGRICTRAQFARIVQRSLSRKPGVASRQELQEFLTAVMRGEVHDGVDHIKQWEQISPKDADWCADQKGIQWRPITIPLPRAAGLSTRLKAAELLGRTICAFVEHVEVSGSIKMTDLLDNDLKQAIPIQGATVIDRTNPLMKLPRIVTDGEGDLMA